MQYFLDNPNHIIAMEEVFFSWRQRLNCYKNNLIKNFSFVNKIRVEI